MLLILLESAQRLGFYGGDFIIFRLNVQRNTKIWIFFVIENSLKFQNSNSISWVMSSYLGQWHRPRYLSIKEGCLFVCHDEISQTMLSFTYTFRMVRKHLMGRSAFRLFYNVYTYGARVNEYFKKSL
jgi:hypothetical protein